MKGGMSKEEVRAYLATPEGRMQQTYIEFAQEKYSNGETSLQYFSDYLLPDALYLLDEPEVSLSPENQVKMANEINILARLLNCQFIIATHSPFMPIICSTIWIFPRNTPFHRGFMEVHGNIVVL